MFVTAFSIINKNIVKMMVDNLTELFPGITEDIVPAKISYLQIERKLQSYIKQGKSIRDFIHILEEMEEELLVMTWLIMKAEVYTLASWMNKKRINPFIDKEVSLC